LQQNRIKTIVKTKINQHGHVALPV